MINIKIEERNIVANILPATTKKISLLWLGGYLSSLDGSKASYLADYAARSGLGLVRFDFSHTAMSSESAKTLPVFCEKDVPVREDFLKTCLSDWLADSKYMYDNYTDNGIIVGSSCGGWIALLLALELEKAGRTPKALVLLAPAPDFTKYLPNYDMSKLDIHGYVYINEGDVNLPFSKKFLHEAKKYYILKEPLDISCPIYIIHGGKDNIVPVEHCLELISYLSLCNVNFTYIKDADHGLSRPQDLEKLSQIISSIEC